MTLERGFRRLLIVFSLVLLGLGGVLDWWFLRPHATVLALLKDGREFTVERNVSKKDLTDRDSVASALMNGEGIYKDGYKGGPPPGDPAEQRTPQARITFKVKGPDGHTYEMFGPPGSTQEQAQSQLLRVLTRVSREDVSAIERVTIVRGPSYRWLTDSNGAIVVGLVALLWIVFYTIRWIARGFTAA